MDILWPALGIAVIVGFVFYVLAGHWGKVLRQQSTAIRRLSDRLQMVEEVDNPHFRERISESAPTPLEQVFTFSFHFSDRFWRDTLSLAESDRDFVRTQGAFVGSIKLERWRSHTAATVTEVLPDHKTAAWQARSLYDYPSASGRSEPLILWELPLARPAFGKRPPSLELVLRGNAIELCGNDVAPNAAGRVSEETVFFRAPLDLTLLAEFQSHDPADLSHEHKNGNGAGSWRGFYAWEDESQGLEWHLRAVDLNRKIAWDRWKILDSAATQVTTGT
jgi:hypothetical protein